MLVYMLVFRFYIRFSEVENYTIFLFVGLLPWLWVTSALTEGTSSIVGSGHLITKSLFPPQILPIVAVVTNMIHFVLALPILVVLMVLSGVTFHWTLIFIPFVILIQFIFLSGFALLLGAVNVHFRDVQHILGNLLTFLFFLTPILYPAHIVPERFRFTLQLNPLALLTQLYQNLIFYGQLPDPMSVLYLSLVAVAALFIGNLVFNSYRESFAELL